jgi:hypothetical protein
MVAGYLAAGGGRGVKVLEFTVTFHERFRVGSAYARDGVDAALDRHDPLPPDHLKGLMRAAASELLGLPSAQVAEVFGNPGTQCPWSWSSARPAEKWDFTFRHRVEIDQASHAALKDHLVLGEQAWAASASFEIRQVGAVPQDRMDTHALVLRCAASAVHGLGAWRRRGLGWVGIVPAGGPVTAGDVAALLSPAGERR